MRVTALAAGMLLLAGCDRSTSPTGADRPAAHPEAGTWYAPAASADGLAMVPEARLGARAAQDAHDDPAVTRVEPGSLTCTGAVELPDPDFTDPDFRDGVGTPGVLFDGVIVTPQATLGERFAGQSVAPGGLLNLFDVLSGSATDPLTAVAGVPGHNLGILPFMDELNAVVGMGTLGYQANDGIGEGAVSVRFARSQAEVGFTIAGGRGDGVTVGFHRADGSLIDSEHVPLPSPLEDVAFRRADGQDDIAGLTLQNQDAGGVGYAAFVICETIRAEIDVKPNSDPSSWKCDNVRGSIPVAILSDAAFDATTVDANTVTFGREGVEAVEVHRTKDGDARRHEEDVNGDGLTDLVLHFAFGESGFTCGDVPDGDNDATLAAFLNAETSDGTPVEGEGEIRLVAGGKGSGDGGQDDGDGKGGGKGRGPH